MEKFKFFEFATADVCFEAYGKTLNELFENAALALFEIIINIKQIKHKTKKEIRIKANDLKSLMIKWLNELLFYVDSESIAFSKFSVHIEKNFLLEAKAFGEKISGKHETKQMLKQQHIIKCR